MNYQVSKYEAIRAVLKAEKCDDPKLAYKMMQIIRRAVRREIEHNLYTEFYVLNEQEKKIFASTSCGHTITVLEYKK